MLVVSDFVAEADTVAEASATNSSSEMVALAEIVVSSVVERFVVTLRLPPGPPVQDSPGAVTNVFEWESIWDQVSAGHMLGRAAEGSEVAADAAGAAKVSASTAAGSRTPRRHDVEMR